MGKQGSSIFKRSPWRGRLRRKPTVQKELKWLPGHGHIRGQQSPLYYRMVTQDLRSAGVFQNHRFAEALPCPYAQESSEISSDFRRIRQPDSQPDETPPPWPPPKINSRKNLRVETCSQPCADRWQLPFVEELTLLSNRVPPSLTTQSSVMTVTDPGDTGSDLLTVVEGVTQ